MKKFDGVNVPRRNDDPFYRYKMPVIKVRVEGRGKMVKTTLENIEDVAKSIERPTDFLMKYFAFELGVQYAVKNDKHTLGSARSADELADLLDIFIDKFILCGSCNNPETMFQCKKNQLVLICRACGHKTIVKYPHRITDYILKKLSSEKKAKKPKTVDKEDPVLLLKNLWKQYPDNPQIVSQAKAIQKQNKWDSEHFIRVIFQSLFDKDILSAFDQKLEIYKLFKQDSEQFYRTTLICIEELCQSESTILPSISNIVEQIYQKELVSYTALKDWQDHPNPDIDKTIAHQIRASTEPLISGLKPQT